MTMEKYSQDNPLLLRQLQDEEHDLLRKVGGLMSQSEKTASEESTLAATENRLMQVRDKIRELLQPKG